MKIYYNSNNNIKVDNGLLLVGAQWEHERERTLLSEFET